MTPTISVFGSSAPRSGSDDYALAEEVGRRLAEAGARVQTGGYAGTMEAASKGAREAGGEVVGVTCDAIETFRPSKPNAWVAEEIRHGTLRERLHHLIEHCDGALVLPGGPGTLAEFALMWNMMLIEELPRRPVVLLGELWARTVEAFVDPRYVSEETRSLFTTAPTPEAAVRELLTQI